MKYLITGFLLLLGTTGALAQNFASYNADELKARLDNEDTVYIVNFWATWCGPCVAELPEFDKVETYYAGKPVKVLLVSLDFKENYKKKLTFYVQRRQPKPEIVWFRETNANDFIPKIDKRWNGSIPATLIWEKKTRSKYFLEQQVTSAQLIEIVDAMGAKE